MQLSELAQDRLTKTAPELTKYIRVFKDMTDEVSDNIGVSIGVFVLVCGGKQFYIPVVSKGGTVYPIDTVFFAEDKTFMPLTKSVIKQIITLASSSMGRSGTAPVGSIKNPDLNELVVPPKTGKFVYAATSRLVEFVAMLPDHLKGKLAAALTDETVKLSCKELAEYREVLSILQTRADLTSVVAAQFPQVITDGEGLPEEIVNDIINKGYYVDTSSRSQAPVTAVAVESSGANTFTYVSNLEAGKAYPIVRRDGTTLEVAILPRPKAADGTQVKSTSRYGDYHNNFTKPTILAISDGGMLIDIPCSSSGARMVATQSEVDYSHILNSVTMYPMSAFTTADLGDSVSTKILIKTPRGFFGPYRTRDVTVEGDTIYVGKEMMISDVYPAGGYLNDGVWLFNSGCLFFPVNTNYVQYKFETDINVAQMRREMRLAQVMPKSLDLSYSDGMFGVDRAMVGGPAEAIKVLVVDNGMDVSDAESFMKQAQEKHSIRIMMTKSAAEESNRRTPMFEHGEKLPPQESGTGTKADRQRGMNSLPAKIRSAAAMRDQQVMEATIMSEILQDQDMIETTSEYLPDIQKAVDKLGRILLLSRMHSAKLSEDYDSEGLSDLITSIRNTFKSLGDNYLMLEQMTHNA